MVPKVNDYLILVMLEGLEPFFEKKSLRDPLRTLKSFLNPYFQIFGENVFFKPQIKKSINVDIKSVWRVRNHKNQKSNLL